MRDCLINTFQPTRPVTPERFAGRSNELLEILRLLGQLLHGLPANFLITGSHGSGKTSLLQLVHRVASGDGAEILPWAKKFANTGPFLVCRINMESDPTREKLLKRIGASLKRELEKLSKESGRSLLSKVTQVAKRIEYKGISFANDTDPDSLIDDPDLRLPVIVDALGKAIESTCTPSRTSPGRERRGVLVLIDDCHYAGPALRLGALLKSITEMLDDEKRQLLSIGIAGRPTLLNVLKEDDPNFLSRFEEIRLGPLSEKDCSDIVTRCVARAGKITKRHLSIDDEALKVLTALSEGHPYFLQQLGYSSLKAAGYADVQVQHVYEATFEAGGAFHKIGEVYFRDCVEQLKSMGAPAGILYTLAQTMGEDIHLSELLSLFNNPDDLKRAVAILVQNNIISGVSGKGEVFRLTYHCFIWWLLFWEAPVDFDPADFHVEDLDSLSDLEQRGKFGKGLKLATKSVKLLIEGQECWKNLDNEGAQKSFLEALRSIREIRSLDEEEPFLLKPIIGAAEDKLRGFLGELEELNKDNRTP